MIRKSFQMRSIISIICNISIIHQSSAIIAIWAIISIIIIHQSSQSFIKIIPNHSSIICNHRKQQTGKHTYKHSKEIENSMFLYDRTYMKGMGSSRSSVTPDIHRPTSDINRRTEIYTCFSW